MSNESDLIINNPNNTFGKTLDLENQNESSIPEIVQNKELINASDSLAKFGKKIDYSVFRSFVALIVCLGGVYLKNSDRKNKEFDINSSDSATLFLMFISAALICYDTVINSKKSIEERADFYGNEVEKNTVFLPKKTLTSLEKARQTISSAILPSLTIAQSITTTTLVLNPGEEGGKLIFEMLKYIGVSGASTSLIFNALDLALETESNNQVSKQNNFNSYAKTAAAASMIFNIAFAGGLSYTLLSDEVDESTKTYLSIGGFLAAKLSANYFKNSQLPDNKTRVIDAFYVGFSSLSIGFASVAPFLTEDNEFVKAIGGFNALNAIASTLDSCVSSFRGMVDSVIVAGIQRKKVDNILDDILQLEPQIIENDNLEFLKKWEKNGNKNIDELAKKIDLMISSLKEKKQSQEAKQERQSEDIIRENEEQKAQEIKYDQAIDLLKELSSQIEKFFKKPSDKISEKNDDNSIDSSDHSAKENPYSSLISVSLENEQTDFTAANPENPVTSVNLRVNSASNIIAQSGGRESP